MVEGSFVCPWIFSVALSCVVFPLRKKMSFSFFALWDWSDFVHSVRFHDAGSVVARGALDTPGSSRCPCRTRCCQSLVSTLRFVQARVLTAPPLRGSEKPGHFPKVTQQERLRLPQLSCNELEITKAQALLWSVRNGLLGCVIKSLPQ